MGPIDEISDHRSLMATDHRVIDEIVREAEERLKMQVQIALSADARSGQLASWEAAGAIALIVAATQNIGDEARAATIVAALLLIAAAAFATFAAVPVAFGLVGTYPSGWLESVRDQEPIAEGKAGYAVWLDKYLKLNDRQMASNNNWLRGSYVAVLLAPVAAGIAALCV